ncbi:MAG: hypothetical protein O3C60_19920 [Planctomycetota bacterium]|nr:hypothetical protein [Planctomycetota bacterium]
MTTDGFPSKTGLVEQHRSKIEDGLSTSAAAEMPWMDGPDRADAGFNVASLLHSLRRCWPRALALGLLASGIAGVLLWIMLPVMYTAEALIEVKRVGQSTDGTQRFESDQAYERFRETQASYIKSTWIISTAMRNDPSISQFYILRKSRNKAAWISDNIKVRPLGDSELLELQLRAENEEEVTKLLSEVIKAYDQKVLQEARKEKSSQLEKLNVAISERRRQADQLTKQYIGMANELEVPTSPSRHAATLEMLRLNMAEKGTKLNDLTRSRSEIDLNIMEAQTLTTSGAGRLSQNLVLDEIERYPEYAEMKKQRTEMENERDRRARSFPNSPDVAQLQSEIARIDQKMKARRKELEPRVRERLSEERGDNPQVLQQRLGVWKAQQKNLSEQIQKLEKEIGDLQQNATKLNAAHADLMQRDDEIQQGKKVLEELSQKRAYLDLDMKEAPRITLVQSPEIREESSMLLRLFEILSASALFFGLTAAGVVLWDYQAKRVNSAADLSSTLDIRMLGSLPLIHNDSLLSFGTRDPRKLELVLTQSADSVRAAVVYNRLVGPVKILMITSAVDQEGRTTLAGQLAISMARSGRKTLLIDADVMNPQQHDVFQIPGNTGLCDVINGSKTPWREVVRATNIEKLWLMPAGTFRGDVQFVGNDADSLFNELRSQYEMIILETGPVLTGAEALLLGQYVDAAILSVRRDESRMPRVEAAGERLRSVGVTILGAVLHNDGTSVRKNASLATSFPQIENSPRSAAGSTGSQPGISATTKFDVPPQSNEQSPPEKPYRLEDDDHLRLT